MIGTLICPSCDATCEVENKDVRLFEQVGVYHCPTCGGDLSQRIEQLTDSASRDEEEVTQEGYGASDAFKGLPVVGSHNDGGAVPANLEPGEDLESTPDGVLPRGLADTDPGPQGAGRGKGGTVPTEDTDETQTPIVVREVTGREGQRHDASLDNTNPGVSFDDTNPGVGLDNTNPGVPFDDTNPGAYLENTNPGVSFDDTNPGFSYTNPNTSSGSDTMEIVGIGIIPEVASDEVTIRKSSPPVHIPRTRRVRDEPGFRIGPLGIRQVSPSALVVRLAASGPGKIRPMHKEATVIGAPGSSIGKEEPRKARDIESPGSNRQEVFIVGSSGGPVSEALKKGRTFNGSLFGSRYLWVGLLVSVAISVWWLGGNQSPSDPSAIFSEEVEALGHDTANEKSLNDGKAIEKLEFDTGQEFLAEEEGQAQEPERTKVAGDEGGSEPEVVAAVKPSAGPEKKFPSRDTVAVNGTGDTVSVEAQGKELGSSAETVSKEVAETEALRSTNLQSGNGRSQRPKKPGLSVKERLHQAQEAVKAQKDYGKAVKLLEPAFPAVPNDIKISYLLCKWSDEAGNPAKAKKYADNVRRLAKKESDGDRFYRQMVDLIAPE